MAEPLTTINKLWIFLLLSVNTEAKGIVGNPLAFARPCNENDKILATYESNRPPGEENQYVLTIPGDITANSEIYLKFDSDATVTLLNPDTARISSEPHRGGFSIKYFKAATVLRATVKGPPSGIVPYPTSIVLDLDELCEKPNSGYFDNLILGSKDTAELSASVPDNSCGRRRVTHTELIVNGEPTKPGDWPWHVALFRIEGLQSKYICGGTLLSKTIILTAAHCTTIRGNPVIPKSLNVMLGKHNLLWGDIAPQEKEVFEVITHPSFNPKTLLNDISLLRLSSEATFTDYVQPACLWSLNNYKKIPSGDVFGTVVGWGINNEDLYSTILEQVTIPKVSEAQCIKSNPVFFSNKLESKFCAGYNNGSSPCNGDSGGGFMVFVPDVSGDRSANATGTWHLHGVVSLSVKRQDASLCDSYQYVLFTDVYKYREWVLKYLN